PLAAIVGQINPRIYVLVLNATESRNIRMPLRRIVAQEIVDLRRERLCADRYRIRITAEYLHTQHRPRPRGAGGVNPLIGGSHQGVDSPRAPGVARAPGRSR